MNIIINSSQAIDERLNLNLNNNKYKGKINISTEYENNLKKNGSQVKILIKDNGIGMPDSIKKKIFDPFYTTKPPEENSGLGLAISKNIIQSLGGDISVSTELDTGTVVTIRLPSGQNGERDQLQNLIELLHGS